MTERPIMKTMQRALTILLATFALPALAQEGVAFVSNVKGEVAIDGNRAAVLSELPRGAKVSLARDAQANVLYVATGKEYVLRGPGEFVVRDTEIQSPVGVPPVMRATEWRPSPKVLGQAAQTSAASVRMRSLAPPRPEPVPRLQFPTQGNVATLQPAFRWTPPEAKGPAEFALSVAGEDKPVVTAKVGAGSYVPSGKLKPDTDYYWVVSAAGQEHGTGRFRTLPGEAIKRIEARRPKAGAEFSDRLLFALMLQELGAVQEAREAWALLARERADLPELAGLAK